MMRSEWFARLLVLLLLGAAVSIPALAGWQRAQMPVLHARMAETGGWTPESLTAVVGQPLHLRLTSDDVTHSFAIGQAERLPGNPQPVDVLPGEISEISLLFDQPGKYTFYCTRWCSINHWRMRGVIEVAAAPGQTVTPAPVEPPLYVQLGLDLDAPHQPSEARPERKPSAQRGAAYGALLPTDYLTHSEYLALSPQALWSTLRAESAMQGLTDQQVWDVLAWLWQQHADPEQRAAGQTLYATNCAACHGEQGQGDGVFAAELAQPAGEDHAGMSAGQMTTTPTNFSDPAHMLAVSPAHLQGKIIRGGMGTGMPYWGPIFTTEQTWAIVAYLWQFQFEMEEP